MRLKKTELKLIEKFLSERCLLAFDFDGTIAPIVKYRKRAKMTPVTKRLMQKVAKVRPVAIVTGRAVSETRVKMRGVRPISIIGNHGAEIGSKVLVSPKKAQAWRKKLRVSLRRIQGADIEDKKYSLSIHYIQSKDKIAAHDEILKAIRQLKGYKLVTGKHVFNLVDPRSPGKGGATEIFMRQQKFKRAIFVGDDVTDEHVFQLNRRKVLGVKIGKGKTHAQIVLKKQSDVNSLLKLIIKNSPQV